MATTRSRPRGRESARPATGGVVTEHATKIYGVAIGSIVVIVAFLALTSIGHVIDAATQHFMLFYAGVFALIALCASVGLGLVATDRMVLNPGHRIFVQSAHRAASFGALAFLIIHIVTEILAQRAHVLDAFVPFLSPFRTFYIGLGTIASDLILLVVITSIVRKRFTAHGKAWRWRAIHYTSYVAFVFGVWHGLLGGRPGKPYVDWSYGFVIAFVALGLAIRILANSLRPKENLSGPAVSDSASSGSAPMRAASMFAQLGVVRAAASASAAVSAPSMAQGMLSAPVGGWDVGPATGPTPALAVLPAAPALPDDGRQPFYEPGYVGPPRYVGAPRSAGTGPMPQVTTGLPRVQSRPATGPQPQLTPPALPRAATGPQPTRRHRPDSAGRRRIRARARNGFDAPRRYRPDAPRRYRPDAPRPLPARAPRRYRPDAPRRDGTDASGWASTVAGNRPGVRCRAWRWFRARWRERSDAACGHWPAAPRRHRSDAPRRDRPHADAAGRGRCRVVAGTDARGWPRVRPWVRRRFAATWRKRPAAACRDRPDAALHAAPAAARCRGGHRADAGARPRPGRCPRPRPARCRRRACGRCPGNGSGPMPPAATGPSPRTGPQPRQRNSARGRGAQQPGSGRNGRGQGQPPGPAWNGQADTTGGAVTWNYDLPPWDGGAPEPDSSFRYREPGPGMPGYRGPRDPYRGGDGRR